jgi:hypothetical protein
LFLYDNIKICEACYEFIKNVQDCKDIKALRKTQKKIITKAAYNSDLGMIKSYELEKPLKHTISYGNYEKSGGDGLNEQGMSSSKISRFCCVMVFKLF